MNEISLKMILKIYKLITKMSINDSVFIFDVQAPGIKQIQHLSDKSPFVHIIA